MSVLEIRQLIDLESSTYTYLLYDSKTFDALIIDPVKANYERDLSLINSLDLNLKYIVETHIHADHITSAYLFQESLGALVAVSKEAKAKNIDIALADDSVLEFGGLKLKAIATPGHTKTCMSFSINSYLFTGDALLIGGCGRTDFQQGSSEALFSSVRDKLFSYPDDVIVYPGHDYNGNLKSTIGDEKLNNKRLSIDKTKEEFISLMASLNLSQPKKIHIAVPANLNAGKLN